MQPIASDGPIIANDLENDFDRIPFPTVYSRVDKLRDQLNGYFLQNMTNFLLKCSTKDHKILTKKFPKKFSTVEVKDLGNHHVRIIMHAALQ